jgi:6-pyruvoyltetrahydropterin/6-carboxytetrahydropterin synthase
MPALESQVKQQVIDRLDHKHLNVDVPEFENVNPSVENIAQVVWGYLANLSCGGTLENVRVYETPKTWADYSGPDTSGKSLSQHENAS